jgi:hypothetical protein
MNTKIHSVLSLNTAFEHLGEKITLVLDFCGTGFSFDVERIPPADIEPDSFFTFAISATELKENPKTRRLLSSENPVVILKVISDLFDMPVLFSKGILPLPEVEGLEKEAVEAVVKSILQQFEKF